MRVAPRACTRDQTVDNVVDVGSGGSIVGDAGADGEPAANGRKANECRSVSAECCDHLTLKGVVTVAHSETDGSERSRGDDLAHARLSETAFEQAGHVERMVDRGHERADTERTEGAPNLERLETP